MAYRGWHARSFDNAFCAKNSGSRLCKYVYEFRCNTAVTIYAMALQPTKRGSWCRDDRKKSYKPGDVSLLLIRLNKDRTFDAIVGGNFFSPDIMARRSIHATLDNCEANYLLVAFSFGAGPVAHGGETRGQAPFKIRVFSSQPLYVRPIEVDHSPNLTATAMAALHSACLVLVPEPGRRFRRQVRPLSTDVCLFQVTGEGTVLLLV